MTKDNTQDGNCGAYQAYTQDEEKIPTQHIKSDATSTMKRIKRINGNKMEKKYTKNNKS